MSTPRCSGHSTAVARHSSTPLPQPTVARYMRIKHLTTSDVVGSVVNKRTDKPAARALSSVAAPVVNVDAVSTGTNVDLEVIRTLPRGRSFLGDILNTAPGVQA